MRDTKNSLAYYILTSAHDEFKERVATLSKADYESLPSAPVQNLNARSLKQFTEMLINNIHAHIRHE